MAYTYTDNLRITKIATGSDAGTWGDRTNENWDRIDAFSGGYAEITLSGSTYTIDTDDGALVGTDGADGWNKILRFIGSPGVTVTVTIDPASSAKWYFVTNACGSSIIFRQTAGTDTVTLEDGYSTIIYCTGGSTKNVIRASDIIGATTAATNVFSGYGVASSRTGIANSVIVGRDAGAALTTQDNNVIIGYEAASTAGTASGQDDNVIIGYRAGKDADGAGGSVFIGSTAGDNVGLDNNVAIGNEAMKGVSGAGDGVANGAVAIGYQAMSNAGQSSGSTNAAEYSVGIGYQSLLGGASPSTANHNTAVGNESGKGVTTGFRNVFLGSQSGRDTTTGTYNISIGSQAGMFHTTGSNNISIGQGTGSGTVGVAGNISIGKEIATNGDNQLNIDYKGGSAPAWGASTTYALNDLVTNDSGKYYICRSVRGAAQSAGSGGPTGTGNDIADNLVSWDYTTSFTVETDSLIHSQMDEDLFRVNGNFQDDLMVVSQKANNFGANPTRTGTITNGDATITLTGGDETTGIRVGTQVTNSKIPAGTTVSSITNSTVFVLSQDASFVGTTPATGETLTFNREGPSTLRLLTDSAASTNFYFLRCGAAGGNKFTVRGDGQVAVDGSQVHAGSADYADMFEWSDGNPEAEDRIGLSVVLDDGGVRPATTSDNSDDIFGVVSGTACVVGNAAWGSWGKKFLKDDFGRVVMEAVDENGSPVLSPDYDESREYISRMARPEWAVVGLAGRIHLRKGSPTNSGWRKIQDVSAVSEEWLVR